MGRPLRVEYRGAMYYITSRGKVNPSGVQEHEIQGKRSLSNTTRNVIMDLFQRNRGVGNLEVGRLFGGIHYSAVSKASGKLKEEMRSDKKLANLVDEIISQFKT